MLSHLTKFNSVINSLIFTYLNIYYLFKIINLFLNKKLILRIVYFTFIIKDDILKHF